MSEVSEAEVWPRCPRCVVTEVWPRCPRCVVTEVWPRCPVPRAREVPCGTPCRAVPCAVRYPVPCGRLEGGVRGGVRALWCVGLSDGKG